LDGLGLEPDLVNDVLGVYRSLPLKLLGVLRDQLLEARLNNLQVLQHCVAILFRHATDEFRGRIIKDRADRCKVQFVAVILQDSTPFRSSPLGLDLSKEMRRELELRSQQLFHWLSKRERHGIPPRDHFESS
jgi:hypothetical protein